MNKLIVLLFVLVLVGCSQGADYTEPVIIIGKDNYGEYCMYRVDTAFNSGYQGKGWGAIKFEGKCDLAAVGDEVVLTKKVNK